MGISDKHIRLKVTSANVPDLTLIDLPGITRVAVKGQPENIGEQVHLGQTCIYKYIKSSGTQTTSPQLICIMRDFEKLLINMTRL